MTSEQCSFLCKLLLKEILGDDAADIGYQLCQWDRLPLQSLLGSSSDKNATKAVLATLIHRGWVSFKEVDDGHAGSRSRIEYFLNRNSILGILRYPRWASMVKSTCLSNEEEDQSPSSSELLFEEIWKSGRLSASRALLRVTLQRPHSSKVSDATIKALKDLIDRRYLKRAVSAENADDEENSHIGHTYPTDKVDLKLINAFLESNERKETDADIYAKAQFPDDDILWVINDDQFRERYRNQIIVEACSRRIDRSAGDLMQIVLNLLSPGFTANFHDISKEVSGHLKTFLTQYMTVITEDRTRFLEKISDSSGGQYRVDMKRIFDRLAFATFDQVVLEKFGSKALRIFRVICEKKRVEESKLQSLVMIPAKETKLLTYKLMENNFIHLQELRKSFTNNTPSKGFYLFYVDPLQLAQMIRELCYKTISNTFLRKNHEFVSNQRLLEKNERVESIVENLKNSSASKEEVETQIEEVYDMLSPPERELTKRVRNALDKLTLAALQVDETLFLIEMYLFYNK